MERFILNDMTFIMPVRFDSIIRLENALVVVNYLYKHFETNIFVLEASSQKNNIFKKLTFKKSVNIFDFCTIVISHITLFCSVSCTLYSIYC
jgi:hypothetical protein